MTESYFRADASQPGRDECLSDMQLAALIDNNLSTQEKQRLFAHLNGCEDCRFCWMEVSASIAAPVVIQSWESWCKRLRKLVSIDFRALKQRSGLAIIATVVFCTVLLLPTQKEIEPMLDSEYALLTTGQDSMLAKQAMKNMPLPWEHMSFGFSPTQVDTATLMFATGLLEGRNALSYTSREQHLPLILQQNNSKRGAIQPLYYQLGRWVASLWFVSQLDGKVDWDKQSFILEQFNSHLRSKNNRDRQTIKTLRRIDIALQEIQQAPHAQDDFRKAVERVMIQLSPASLGEGYYDR